MWPFKPILPKIVLCTWRALEDKLYVSRLHTSAGNFVSSYGGNDIVIPAGYELVIYQQDNIVIVERHKR